MVVGLVFKRNMFWVSLLLVTALCCFQQTTMWGGSSFYGCVNAFVVVVSNRPVPYSSSVSSSFHLPSHIGGKSSGSGSHGSRATVAAVSRISTIAATATTTTTHLGSWRTKTSHPSSSSSSLLRSNQNANDDMSSSDSNNSSSSSRNGNQDEILDANKKNQQVNDHNSSSSSNSNNNNKKYPIDLPSPILLASSMVLAIASIGSIFELTITSDRGQAGGGGGGGGESTGAELLLGFVPTLGIAIVGLPLCLFLFYAAIQKGIAETEADDAAYQRRGGNYNNYNNNKW